MKAIPITLLLTTAAAISAVTPSPDELLAKARKALGGDAKLSEIKTLVITGTYRRNLVDAMSKEPNIMSGDSEISVLLPDKFLKEETITLPTGDSGPTLLEALNGEKMWNDTRSQGPGMIFIRTAGGDAAARTQGLRAQFARYLLAWMLCAPANFQLQFTYAGEAEAPDGRADAIDAKGPDNFAVRLFLDKESHMPLMLGYRSAARMSITRRTTGGGEAAPDPHELLKQIEKSPSAKPREVDYQLHLSDYRKVSGIQLPFHLSWTSEGSVTEEFEVKKYTINQPLKPEKFEKK